MSALTHTVQPVLENTHRLLYSEMEKFIFTGAYGCISTCLRTQQSIRETPLQPVHIKVSNIQTGRHLTCQFCNFNIILSTKSVKTFALTEPLKEIIFDIWKLPFTTGTHTAWCYHSNRMSLPQNIIFLFFHQRLIWHQFGNWLYESVTALDVWLHLNHQRGCTTAHFILQVMPLVVPNLDVGPLQGSVFFAVLDDRTAEKQVSF